MPQIEGGYYIKARCIQNSAIAIAPPHVREIWDWLIKECNHADRKVNGIIIKRGQCLRSYRDIQEGLKWKVGYRIERYKKSHCEIAMKVLTRLLMITTTKTTRGLIITICNYNIYQDPKNYESHNVTDNETTREPQPADTINKNGKKKELKKKEKDYPSEVTDIVDSFHRYLLGSEFRQCKSVENWNKEKQCDAVEKLHRLDKYSFSEIQKVILYIQKDEFWSKQVQSLSPLRKKSGNDNMKFENILISMDKKKTNQSEFKGVM